MDAFRWNDWKIGPAATPQENQMKKKQSYFNRFMAMTDAQRDAEVAKFDKEDLAPGKALTKSERNRFEKAVQRGRPRLGLGAEKIRISVERGLLMKTDQLAKRLHVTRSQLIADGLRKLLKSA